MARRTTEMTDISELNETLLSGDTILCNRCGHDADRGYKVTSEERSESVEEMATANLCYDCVDAYCVVHPTHWVIDARLYDLVASPRGGE